MKVLANNQVHESPRLRLNADKVRGLQRAHEIDTDAEFARRVNIDPSTFHRYMKGESCPSNQVLARFKAAFPQISLDDLTLLDLEAAA